MPPKSRKKAKAQRTTNKGWAEGAREDLLNEYVHEFANSMGKGMAAEDEVLRAVYRRYFFHFDLDDNIEPDLPLKPFDEAWVPPSDEGQLEELRAKRELRQRKKIAIRAWLMYRALKVSSIRATVRRCMLSDAYLALLNKVGKLGKRPPKARSAFQEWQARNKGEATRIVQELWDQELNAGRQKTPKRGGICPKFRQATVKAHFLSFDVETQKLWAAKATSYASERRKEWDEVFNGEPSTSAEDRAACVKNLPTFLQPVAEGIMNLTGLMTVVHVVGPLGVLNGEIGVITVCSGKNLDQVPVSVAKWEPKAYEGWREHLVKFADSAYTQADKEAARLSTQPQLPADFQGEVFDDDSLDKVVQAIDTNVAAKDSGELGATDDEDSEDSGEEDDERKCPAASSSSARKRRTATDNEDSEDSDREGNELKRPAASSSSSARKRQRTADDAEKSKKGKVVKVDGVWKSEYEIQRDANMKRNRALLDALEVNTGALFNSSAKKAPRAAKQRSETAPEDGVRRQSSRLNVQGAADPRSGKEAESQPMDVDQPIEDSAPMRPSETSNTVMVNPVLSVIPLAVTHVPHLPDVPLLRASPASQAPSADASARPPVSPTDGAGNQSLALNVETPTESRAMQEANDATTALGSGGMVTGMQLDDEVRELALEAPDWFSVPFRVFASPDWGDEWRALLEAFVKLESSADFGGEVLLPRAGRPDILSDWIADGRLKPKKTGAPARRMLVLKAKDVPAFQARFCSWWDGMQPSWRKQDESGKWIQKRHGRDFGELDAWGPNGWLSVVACLYWWGEVEKDVSARDVWGEYVNDAAWMMDGLRVRG